MNKPPGRPSQVRGHWSKAPARDSNGPTGWPLVCRVPGCQEFPEAVGDLSTIMND